MRAIRGDRVRTLRRKLDMTQFDVSAMVPMTQSHLSHIECGRVTSVGSVILTGLARILETNTDYLTGESDDPRPSRRRSLGTLAPDEEELIRMYRQIRTPSFRLLAQTQVQMALDLDQGPARRPAAGGQQSQSGSSGDGGPIPAGPAGPPD